MKISYNSDYEYLTGIPSHTLVWFENNEKRGDSISIMIYEKRVGFRCDRAIYTSQKHKVVVKYREDGTRIIAQGYIWKDGVWILFHETTSYISDVSEDALVVGMYELLTYV